VRGAFVEGCTYGVASGFVYLAETLLVGAAFSSPLPSLLDLNSWLSVCFSSRSFSEPLSDVIVLQLKKLQKKLMEATSVLNKLKLLRLSTATDESRSLLHPELIGCIIAGASGSGKFYTPSRRYEPDSGSPRLIFTLDPC
jgi:ATP-binding cassette subfamily B (MDR/TAP) protein 1